MSLHRSGRVWAVVIVTAVSLASARGARAQTPSGSQTPRSGSQAEPAGSRWVVDLAFGVASSINGNVNSGAIGTLQGQTVAILPQSYGSVYGTGIDFRFGAGYRLNAMSELRGMFVWQTADADLVRLGDLGPSSLYGQYSDYKSLSLDFGYRRYVSLDNPHVRMFGEATIGVGFIDAIDVQLAAPQSNIIFSNTDFYDSTAALTFGVNVGVLFKVADRTDLTAQIGLRHVSGLTQVDQLVGTGLANLNDDSSRLTVPIVVGVRFHF
jgi:hypothetical protein